MWYFNRPHLWVLKIKYMYIYLNVTKKRIVKSLLISQRSVICDFLITHTYNCKYNPFQNKITLWFTCVLYYYFFMFLLACCVLFYIFYRILQIQRCLGTYLYLCTYHLLHIWLYKTANVRTCFPIIALLIWIVIF